MNDKCCLCGASNQRPIAETIPVAGRGTITLHYAVCDECGTEIGADKGGDFTAIDLNVVAD